MRVSTGGFGISFIYPPRNHPDLTCRSRACCEKEMEGIRTNETGSVSVKTHGAIFIYLARKAFTERDLSGIEERIL